MMSYTFPLMTNYMGIHVIDILAGSVNIFNCLFTEVLMSDDSILIPSPLQVTTRV